MLSVKAASESNGDEDALRLSMRTKATHSIRACETAGLGDCILIANKTDWPAANGCAAEWTGIVRNSPSDPEANIIFCAPPKLAQVIPPSVE